MEREIRLREGDSRRAGAKHVLDSIAGAVHRGPAVRGDASGGARAAVLDVGSGAGFPGIPLAIALPGIGFTLLERSAKKCAFLENCRALLGLANVRVLQADLSGATGRFDVVTFRAVAPLDRFLADLARSGIAWRWVASYKGRRDRIDAELAALGSGRARRRGAARCPCPSWTRSGTSWSSPAHEPSGTLSSSFARPWPSAISIMRASTNFRAVSENVPGQTQ